MGRGEQRGRFWAGAGNGEEVPAWDRPKRQGSSQEGWRGGEPHFWTPLPPAVITLPNKYKGLVRGLCGNFDGNKRNDYMLPNGTVTQNLLAFGNSWEVQRIEGGDLVRFSR